MEKRLKIPIVVDTKTWLSYVIGKTIKKLEEIVKLESIIIIFSESFKNKLRVKTTHKKFKQFFEYSDFFKFFGWLISVFEFHEPEMEINICGVQKIIRLYRKYSGSV